MTENKKDKLAHTISTLQQRWGSRIIGRYQLQSPADFPAISTSFPQLDEALGIGGIPRGRISELAGVPTSGMATLALKITAQAQRQGGSAVFLDLTRTFDAGYAWRCGVQLPQLTLIKPYTPSQSLAILSDLAINGGIDLIIFDMPLNLQTVSRTTRSINSTLGRILAPLSKNDSTLLFLTSLSPQMEINHTQDAPLSPFATLRLLLTKERWLYKERDIRGYEAQVLIAKNKLYKPGQHVRISITFNGTVDGDSI
jgi:recombination protein RecA